MSSVFNDPTASPPYLCLSRSSLAQSRMQSLFRFVSVCIVSCMPNSYEIVGIGFYTFLTWLVLFCLFFCLWCPGARGGVWSSSNTACKSSVCFCAACGSNRKQHATHTHLYGYALVMKKKWWRHDNVINVKYYLNANVFICILWSFLRVHVLIFAYLFYCNWYFFHCQCLCVSNVFSFIIAYA